MDEACQYSLHSKVSSLEKKSQSLSSLSDIIIINLNNKVKESYETNCHQVTTGLLVVVPLMETISGNQLTLLSLAMLCQTEDRVVRPSRKEGENFKGMASVLVVLYHAPSF